MKKKMWLTLCNIGVSVVFLLSLYSYTKGMEGAEVNGNKIYHVSEILRYACAIILAIAVWRNGFK